MSVKRNDGKKDGRDGGKKNDGKDMATRKKDGIGRQVKKHTFCSVGKKKMV